MTDEHSLGANLGAGAAWVCPVCGWRHVNDHPTAEQQRLADEGWWWCEQGHERATLVREGSSATP